MKLGFILLVFMIILTLFLPTQKEEKGFVDIKIKADLFTSFEVDKKIKIFNKNKIFLLGGFLKKMEEEFIILKVKEKDLKSFDFEEFYHIYPLIDYESKEVFY